MPNMVFLNLKRSDIYALVNWVAIGLGNGLSPIYRQDINQPNRDFLLIGQLGTNLNDFLINTRKLILFSKKISSAKKQIL